MNSRSRDDDGWSQATTVHSSSAAAEVRAPAPEVRRSRRPSVTASAPPAAPASDRSARFGDTAQWRQLAFGGDGTPANQRGLSGSLAVAIMIGIAAIGCIIDLARGSSAKGGLNIGIVVAALVAVVLVRRSGIFPVIVAPPLVYAAGSIILLVIRSGGLSNRKALYDVAANWLVYGFPALAAATAVVLVIAGLRLVTHK